MLWIRAIFFTLLAPGAIGVLIPQMLLADRAPRQGLWRLGLIALVLGATIYLWSLLSFVARHGTGAIFFTRSLRWLIGSEPPSLVHEGPYRYSRNPMYVAVLLIVFGQAAMYASTTIAAYGIVLAVCFHLVVVHLEEPHLRRKQGRPYEDYCRRVPRWFGHRRP